MSLAELLAGLALGALMAAGAAEFGQSTLRHMARQQLRRDLRQALSVTAEMFEREWRLAGYHARGDSFDGVPSASANAIRFEADLNGDRDVDDAHEQISYSWDAERLSVMRSTLGASPQPWLSEVPDGGFLLRYFDHHGQELFRPEEQRRAHAVSLQLIVERRLGAAEQRETLTLLAARRNTPP